MLMQMTIGHYVIIDKLDLPFDTGMTTITGETGAGKSIIVDALDLILGKRADQRCVASEQDQCDISALFDIQSIAMAKDWLTVQGLLDQDEPNTCLLRRYIHRSQPSRAYINGQLVTLTQLRELASLLVYMHGQHAHQLLLKSAWQNHLLDNIGEHQALCDQVKIQYGKWQTACQALENLRIQSGGNTQEKQAYLAYQIDELRTLDLKQGDAEQLELKIKQLNQQADVNAAVAQGMQKLANDDTNPVLTALSTLQALFSRYHDLHPPLQSISQLIEQAYIHAQEAYEALQHFQDSTLLNLSEQQALETRLSTVYDLARKHRVNAQDLHTVLARLETELASLSDIDHHIIEQEKHIQMLATDYIDIAKPLSYAREKTAALLSQQVTDTMQELGMAGGYFKVALSTFSDGIPRANGLEQATFVVSTNPGLTAQPLAKVASGGEISRISLAIQLIAAKQNRAATLVFDEVDVGIGGKTAAIVGTLLRQLSEKTQVICITHLPQVAAMGHQQLCVQKNQDHQQTKSTITQLSDKARIDEIARMLGGLEITAKTRENAKSLLDNNQPKAQQKNRKAMTA